MAGRTARVEGLVRVRVGFEVGGDGVGCVEDAVGGVDEQVVGGIVVGSCG